MNHSLQLILDELFAHPEDYDFFQALRIIECSAPDLPRIGKSRSLMGDKVRFGQFLSLGFATETLESFDLDRPDDALRKLLIRFTGLTGPNGPLPLRMTEYIRNRQRGTGDPDTIFPASSNFSVQVSPKDNTLADFLDVFHHRLISLFYRAWAGAQKSVDLDRPDQQRFSVWIASTFGTGMAELMESEPMQKWSRLAFAGHLSNQTRHPEGLVDILSCYFETKVELTSFYGHWLPLAKDDRYVMSGRNRAGGEGQLGRSITIGTAVWDCQLKFLLKLGPLRWEQFQRYLPGGEANERLRHWVAYYTHRQYFWEAVIILHKDDIPATQLGKSGSLGRTCWMKSGPVPEHSRDFVIKEDLVG